jgi:DNA repair ATPase RecN
MLYRKPWLLSGRKIKPERDAVTEKHIEDFLESVNDLQSRYKDLIKLIEDDPQLKKEIEKRLKELQPLT